MTLETSLAHPSANIANVSLKCALVFLQSHPECLPMINTVVPYVLKCTQLDEMYGYIYFYTLFLMTDLT